MKTEVHVLGSGSAGNLVVLRCDDQLLLVDIGFSAKETERRLKAADLAVAGITGILITHEHEGPRAWFAGLRGSTRVACVYERAHG